MKFLKVLPFALLFSFSLHSAEQQLIVVRHGEAGNNIEKVYNSNPENPNYKRFNLTEAGILTTQKTAKDLIAKDFLMTILSQFLFHLYHTPYKLLKFWCNRDWYLKIKLSWINA